MIFLLDGILLQGGIYQLSSILSYLLQPQGVPLPITVGVATYLCISSSEDPNILSLELILLLLSYWSRLPKTSDLNGRSRAQAINFASLKSSALGGANYQTYPLAW